MFSFNLRWYSLFFCVLIFSNRHVVGMRVFFSAQQTTLFIYTHTQNPEDASEILYSNRLAEGTSCCLEGIQYNHHDHRKFSLVWGTWGLRGMFSKLHIFWGKKGVCLTASVTPMPPHLSELSEMHLDVWSSPNLNFNVFQVKMFSQPANIESVLYCI